jgi:hypothetical protein
MKTRQRLYSPQQAHGVWNDLWQQIKAGTMAGNRYEVEVRQERRSLPQNAKLHALIGQIAQRCEWAGRKWDAEDWKRLLTAGWMRATQQQAVIVPAIDGSGFDVLYRRTSELDKHECGELLEYVQAWAAEKGIEL